MIHNKLEIAEEGSHSSDILDIQYFGRVHLFPNGKLTNGKALSFNSTTSFQKICEEAARKFNMFEGTSDNCRESDEKRVAPSSSSSLIGTNNSTTTNTATSMTTSLSIHSAATTQKATKKAYCKIKLFTLKGSEIEETKEIIHDDVLFVLRDGEEFIPPLPMEILLTLQPPQSRMRLTAVTKRSPLVHFFDRFLPELYHTVFSFFNHRGLFILSLVCKKWYNYANQENLWKELCANTYYWREKRRRDRRFVEENLDMDVALSVSKFHGFKASHNTKTHKSSSDSSTINAIPNADGNENVPNHDGGNSTNVNSTSGNSKSIHDDEDDNDNDSKIEGCISSSSSSSSSNGTSHAFCNSNVDYSAASAPKQAAPRETQSDGSLKIIFKKFYNRKEPPIYKSWKTFFRYYILWAGSLTWDTTERGVNIKFKNNNMTIYRDDLITHHWQTVRSAFPIYIPSENEKKQNGVFEGNPDDIAIYEWEIYIDTFDKTVSNGWWIVFGLETEQFCYKESTPTSLIGYDRNLGWGYACGNGDSLHCYSNPTLKNRQLYTCDPIKPWCNTPYKQGDVVRARLKYCTKVVNDAIDPKEHIGATLEFFLNGKYLGQAFRNITASAVYPAVSILPNQTVTLRIVDPIMETTDQ